MVKVVRIAFIAVLQLVEEIQEAKRERRRGSINRCWKPASAEKLNILGDTSPHVTAIAVTNDKTKNAAEIKHHQVEEVGWFGAHLCSEVAKLGDKSESSEGGFFEERAIPLLENG